MRSQVSRVSEWIGVRSGRRPLFAAALVAVCAVMAAHVGVWFGIATACGAGTVGWASGGWRRGCCWLGIALVAAGGLLIREADQKRAELGVADAPGGMTRVRVLEDADGSERYWVAPVRLLDGEWQGRKVWWEGRGESPVAGAVVMARGNFGPLEPPRNPGEFDRASWLRAQGVVAVFRTSWAPGEVETGRLAAWGAAVRHGFRERVTAGLPAESREVLVIRAVVMGEKPADSDALIAAFRQSGTLHVFSVSGLHVTMVCGIAWLVLAFAGVTRRRAIPLLLPVVFGYAWLTGCNPPAVRAAWMMAVFLGAFGFRRQPDLLNALGTVLLVGLLWDGRMLFHAGVQLSYGVVAAIAVGVSWTSKWFSGMARADLYLPERMMNRWQRAWLWARRWVAGMLGTSTAAAIGSAPLTAWHFGLFTPVSIVAALVLIPTVFLMLWLALSGVVFSFLSDPVSRGLNRANGVLAGFAAGSAEWFASVPGGHYQLRGESGPSLLVYDLEYGAGAACFSGGDGAAVLFDCGDRMSFRGTLVPSLRYFGIEPDSVVLSHPDGGHLGGAAPVWEAFPVRQALMPVEWSRSPSYRTWMEMAPRAGVRLHRASGFVELAFPDQARLEVLHVPDPLAKNAKADERVALYRLHWRGWRILFTSDMGIGVEMELLDAGVDPAADVIVAGRHRSDLTLCDRFLDAVKPRAIVASNPVFPPEEKRDPATVEQWKGRGLVVFDQRRSGGVTMRVDKAGRLILEGYVDGSRVELSPH